MNRRLLLGIGLVVVLASLAGCTSIFGGQPDSEKLAANATYDWDTDANVTYNVTRSQFTGIIEVENRSSLVVYQTDELGTDEPLPLQALKFRYPNGTVITAESSKLNVRNENQRTNITLPQDTGKVGFRAKRPTAKRFATPLFVEGSHEVILPKRARVGIPLLSKVSPSPEWTRVDDSIGRMVIHWDSVERGPIVARYYLQRDILIFGALGGVLAVAGVIGAAYYLRQIRTLKRRREEIGLDVETEEDEFDQDDPPPGMK